MLYAFLLVFAALVVADRLHRARIDTIVLEHRFRLYALRDDLREAAMSGSLAPRHWLFLYLDSTIAKTIRGLDRLTIWELLAFSVAYRNSERMAVAHRRLVTDLERAEHARFRDCYGRYRSEVLAFLMDRHFVIRLAMSPVLAARRMGGAIKRRCGRLAELVGEAPQTSTLDEFVVA